MSLLRRNPRNRRAGREQKVLDVRLRSDQVRANRLRWSAIGLVMLITTLAGFFLIWRAGGWALDYFVYENPAFAIERIEVRTDGVIPAGQIRKWSGVRIGQNLLALDLTRVKRDLEMVPDIRTATVERAAPHALKLSIVERVPLAQISVLRLKPDGAAEPSTVRLDRDAFVMAPNDWTRSSAARFFPAVCGLNLGEVSPGRRIDSAGVRGALQLIMAFQQSPMSHLTTLQQIDVSMPDVLQVTTTNLGVVVFSLDNFPQQLRRWRDISDHARELGKAVVSLDLSVPDNIPADFTNVIAAATLPGQNNSNLKSQPLKKRDV